MRADSRVGTGKVGPTGNPAELRLELGRKLERKLRTLSLNYSESLLRPAADACREHLSLMSEARRYLRKAADLHPP